jgi:hypothetical protein
LLERLEADRRQQEADRRARLLAGLEFDGCEEIVFAERGAGRDPGGHYYANFGYASVDPDLWIHGADGGRLLKLNVRTGELVPLLDDPGGAVRDPVVHYDGGKILFSYRKAGSSHYHLYEIDADGSKLRQLTDGPFDDIEPAYLPDGDIVFCSSRCNRWIGCFFTQTAVLYRCGPDGDDLRMLSSGAFTENTPAVLPDGRVLYTRWEYVNRDPVSFHHLWTVFPDGSGQTVFYGNMHAGGVFIDARPIPDSEELVLINSPGHGRNEHAGYVALLSGKQGPDDQRALRNITGSADFRDPYPLSADRFLVARGNQLLLMDRQGAGQVIYTGEQMVHEPRALRPRRREVLVPPRSDRQQAKATLLLADVYTGRNMEGVAPGTIERLLVLEDLPKPVNFHGGGSQPIGHGVTSTLKRILGTVPVEPDGSAHFEVPAMRSIYFAALDASGRSVKQMRSFVTLQPGESPVVRRVPRAASADPGIDDRHAQCLRPGTEPHRAHRRGSAGHGFPPRRATDLGPALRRVPSARAARRRRGAVRRPRPGVLAQLLRPAAALAGQGYQRPAGASERPAAWQRPALRGLQFGLAADGHARAGPPRRAAFAPREEDHPSLDRYRGGVHGHLRGTRLGPGGRDVAQQRADSSHGRRLALDPPGRRRHRAAMRPVPSGRPVSPARDGPNPYRPVGRSAVLAASVEPLFAASDLQSIAAGPVAGAAGAVGPRRRRRCRRPPA